MNNIIPTIVDIDHKGERHIDIYSKMLKERIIFVNGEINDFTAMSVVSQLIFLESEDKNKDIYMYINSPGGLVTAGLAIYDTMQYINAKISTICIGQACSMGALLLLSGEKNKRFALPNARVMIHQPMGGSQGQATDIAIHAREILKVKDQITKIIAIHTGQQVKKVKKDMERDHFMSSVEAQQYGIVDDIFQSKT